MDGNEWTNVLPETALKEGVPVTVEVDGKKVLVVLVEGKIYACGNECSHYHAPLSDGLLTGHIITCPWHNARFDVLHGGLDSPPGLNDLSSYEAKIEGGGVLLRQVSKGTIPMPEGMDERTFLIVGAGAAGNTAAETLRREGFSGRIVMVTGEEYGPYDRTMLSKDIISGEAPAKWLPLRGSKFFDRLKIEVLTNHEVTALDPNKLSVTFTDGTSMKADGILLATGGVPRRLEVPGAEKKGCFLLRSRADAEALLDALEGAQRVVVVGASFIGLEVASALRSRKLEVHVVGPEPLPLARIFGEQVGGRIKRSHEQHGVVFHLETTVGEITGAEAVAGVKLADGSAIEADCVVIGVGIRPAVDFLEGSGLVADGAVPVNAQLQTEAPGIFAAGDIALVPDGRTGEPRRVEHWVEAERQGRHAARCLLGGRDPYREVPFFWSKQYGSSLRYVGYAPGFDEVAIRGDVDGDAFVAGYYKAGVLKAAAGVGTARDIIRLGQLLEAGKSVEPEDLRNSEFALY